MKKIFIIIVFSLFSCKGNLKKEDINKASKETKPIDSKHKKEINKETDNIDSYNINLDSNENFNIFLNNFISSPLFRYQRIEFPLKGFNSDSDSDEDQYLWYKDDWYFYFEEDSVYKANPNIISKITYKDSLVIWRLYKENSGYDINYYFKSKGEKWYLDYYSYTNY